MASLAPLVPPDLLKSLANQRRLPPTGHVDWLDAALLFSDISGFTALTEKLQQRGREGAEEISTVINRAFRPLLRALDRWEGSVFSFGGDAVFVVFSGQRAVSRAVAAAEEIRDQFERRGLIKTSVGATHLRIKQAIHCGRVKAAHLGSETRRHYLVCGASVSALARLEKEARSGRILLSAAARRRAAGERRPKARARNRLRVPPALVKPYVVPHVLASRAHFRGEFRRAVMAFIETKGHSLRRLQRFVLLLDEVLARFGGVLVSPDLSPVGTKWLCAFGAPTIHEDDGERAARTVIEILARCPAGLDLRGGMHAGTVANTWIGGPTRRSYELLGDVTNTAARAAAKADWGEFLVTEAMQSHLRAIETRPRGSHRVKGKSRPLILHAIEGVRNFAGQVRVTGPMIGRDDELERIRHSLTAARRRRGSAFGIKGDAGMGKSRLKQEAVRLASELGFAVHEGRAASFQGKAYWTMGSLIKGALGVPEIVSREEILSRVDRASSELGLRLVDRHHLAEVLGARHPNSPIEQLDAETIRLNNNIAVESFVRALSRAQPRLLVLEDMHWADGASADTARWLARGVAKEAIVLLELYRPGYKVTAEATEIPLAELPDASVEALVLALLGSATADIVKRVRRKAGGNPFFVEEMVRHLEEGSVGRGAPDTVGGLGDRIEGLPPSIEALIAARLDRLSPQVRRVAQLASVIGRQFSLELLGRLSAVSRYASAAVEELAARELLVANPGDNPTTEYAFKHALTRDVVYAGIFVGHRRQDHRAVANAMEAALGDAREDFLAVIGHHREQAGQRGSGASGVPCRRPARGSTIRPSRGGSNVHELLQASIAVNERGDRRPKRAGCGLSAPGSLE